MVTKRDMCVGNTRLKCSLSGNMFNNKTDVQLTYNGTGDQ